MALRFTVQFRRENHRVCPCNGWVLVDDPFRKNIVECLKQKDQVMDKIFQKATESNPLSNCHDDHIKNYHSQFDAP